MQLQAGGAIHVGVEAFQASTGDSEPLQLPASNATAAGNATATAAKPATPGSPYATVRHVQLGMEGPRQRLCDCRQCTPFTMP